MHKTNKYLGYGLGLRSQHYEYILENRPHVDWFEIISENYMDNEGYHRDMIRQIAQHYPIVMHGVCMSIGTTDPLDTNYLDKLRALADDVKPEWISDHLCFTGVDKIHTHDLLPVCYTPASLAHITDRIKQVQDYLGRQILLENPSSYLSYKADNITEWDFLSQMAEIADCKLLLDVNNIFVSSFNHGFNSDDYVNNIALDRVQQIHLAGHTQYGNHIIDTHKGQVAKEVWDIYSKVINKAGHISTMVEWDADIPDFPVLEAEINKARQYVSNSKASKNTFGTKAESSAGYKQTIQPLQDDMLEGTADNAKNWINDSHGESAEKRIDIYIKDYRYRLYDCVKEDYEAVEKLLGSRIFRQFLIAYIEENPPKNYSLVDYSIRFAGYLANCNIAEYIKQMADMESLILSTSSKYSEAPLQLNDFQHMSEEEFGSLTPKLVASATIKHYDYDIVEYIGNIYNNSQIKDINSATPAPQESDVVEPETNPPAQQKIYVVIYRKGHQVMWQKLLLEQHDFATSNKIMAERLALHHDNINDWLPEIINIGVLTNEQK